MAKYLSQRQRVLNVGVVSYTESDTTLSVVGKVGIGTTNAFADLDVIGDARIRGALYDFNNILDESDLATNEQKYFQLLISYAYQIQALNRIFENNTILSKLIKNFDSICEDFIVKYFNLQLL